MLKKKNLSFDMALRISNSLAFKNDEKDYFCNLVLLENTQSHQEKEYLLEKIKNIRPESDFYIVDLEQFKSIADWNHNIILEMTELSNFKPDPAWIASKVGISKIEAESALERLLRLGFLKEKNGTFVKSKPFYSMGTEKVNHALRNFHKKTLEKAVESIETQSNDEKDLSTITVSIDLKKLPQAKEEIKKFRRKMINFLGSGKQTETYQLVIALFRATQKEKK
ncbi:MAG: DUF4423 domain-containing protein [Deltaproteobacteria bacterium]|nr:DUF4423 domain-containing protein [Deltaproteobacteria bacterium]